MIAIYGKDDRYPYLCEMLRQDGLDARLAQSAEEFLDAALVISRYPMESGAEVKLSSLSPGARLLLLPAGEVPALARPAKLLSEDAAFVNENAVLTAEGALHAAMSRAPFALTGERALVVGYGRIGRALTEMLVGLRANVAVASRRESGRLQAMARGARAVDMAGMRAELPDARTVFVTSPDRVLTREDMAYISRRALLLDLSSAPHGADMDAAREMGLNARVESALPGRYCPESAARATYRAVKRAICGGEAL